MKTRDRRGFTLVELMIVAVVGAMVVGATYQILLSSQRAYMIQSAQIQGRQTVRAGVDILFAELRELSRAEGDILTMGSDKIEFRAMRAFGLVCRIIHMSSVLGRGASPVHKSIGYQVSKAGTDGLMRQQAVEWAEHGILVNCLAPGYIPTELTIDPRTGRLGEEDEATIRTYTPMRRPGEPEEVRSALLFLTSPASSYVTGSVVSVDGGWTAW